MMREQLAADEIRDLDEGAYIVVELHEDEYWMQGEGRVEWVTEYDSKTTVGIRNRGYSSRLHVPSDARCGLTFDGAAGGADGLRVEAVYERNT